MLCNEIADILRKKSNLSAVEISMASDAIAKWTIAQDKITSKAFEVGDIIIVAKKNGTLLSLSHVPVLGKKSGHEIGKNTSFEFSIELNGL